MPIVKKFSINSRFSANRGAEFFRQRVDSFFSVGFCNFTTENFTEKWLDTKWEKLLMKEIVTSIVYFVFKTPTKNSWFRFNQSYSQSQVSLELYLSVFFLEMILIALFWKVGLFPKVIFDRVNFPIYGISYWFEKKLFSIEKFVFWSWINLYTIDFPVYVIFIEIILKAFYIHDECFVLNARPPVRELSKEIGTFYSLRQLHLITSDCSNHS